MFGCHRTAGGDTGPWLGESTCGVELSLAQSKAVPITLVILDRTLKYVGSVYSNLNGAVSTRLVVTTTMLLWKIRRCYQISYDTIGYEHN
jgi:hypothetical protein